MTRIAIIGAGISGLALAERLVQVADVTIFEKARGVGGRMSTRYAEPFYFDHGAQFFTARTPDFQNFLAAYMEAGTVAEWNGKVVTLGARQKETKRLWFEPHLVASPHMNSLCKALSVERDVRTGCEVAPLDEADRAGWKLHDKDGHDLGLFDWVISTAPPAQTVRLLGRHMPDSNPLQTRIMQGCYALMIGFHRPWDRQWIAASVQDNLIGWISVNSSKPARNPELSCLVVHSSHEWAEAHIDDDMNEAQAYLLQQFTEVTGIDSAEADYITTHRWRYATTAQSEQIDCYIDRQRRIAATGDWCVASRIEDAWLQARRLATMIVEELK